MERDGAALPLQSETFDQRAFLRECERMTNAALSSGTTMAAEQRTQFDYLLNAVLHAAQADKPAEHGYHDKTLALFAYVRHLERRIRELHAERNAGVALASEPNDK